MASAVTQAIFSLAAIMEGFSGTEAFPLPLFCAFLEPFGYPPGLQG
jgi:hypothetical protein